MNEVADTSRPPSRWLADRFRKFFFAKEVPYGMALARIFLPSVLLIDIIRRWIWARELYSLDGAPAPLAENFGSPHFFPQFPAPVAMFLYTALAFFMMTSAVGWFTRFSLAAATALYYYFGMLDCLSTMSKYTVIATHLLLLLTLSPCGDLWSVDAWLKRRRARAESPDEILSHPSSAIWPQRLAQILFGMIYFGAAVTKLHIPEFFTGDQLVSWMMTYINNEHPLGDYLSQYPLFVSVSCFITFLWELTFVFTIWNRRLRWYILAIGSVFHIMTFFTLGLIIFPIVMMICYFSFIDEADVRAMRNWRLVRLFMKGAPAPAVAPVSIDQPAPEWNGRYATVGAFALLAIVICLAGVEAEHLTDHYKMRGPDGPLPLRELSREEVDRMFAPDRPMRQCDKLLAFDLGSVLIGEHLADRRIEFRQGEKFYAQASFNMPHEDMWVDCVLCEAASGKAEEEGRMVPGPLVTKVGQPVYREMFRGNFVFMLNDTIEPGEYFLKLRSRNEEMVRKHFKVLPGVKTARATDGLRVKAAAGN